MGKKIAFLNPSPDPELFRPWGAGLYQDAHAVVLEKSKAPDTEIMQMSLPPGVWMGQQSVNDYFMNGLIVPTICKGVMDAEEQGADAAIIVCTDDPGLRQARSLVDIPVIGEFESMVHLAATMGHKFGVLCWPTRPFMARSELKIQTYGLTGKAIANPIEPIVEPGPNAERTLMTEAFQDPQKFVETYYLPAAQRLIARGAEVIVIDSTGLSLVAATAGFSEVTDVGIGVKTSNPAVPVLNAVTVSLKFAEMMADLRELGIQPASRIGLYQKPQDIMPKQEFDMMRAAYEKDWQEHDFLKAGPKAFKKGQKA